MQVSFDSRNSAPTPRRRGDRSARRAQQPWSDQLLLVCGHTTRLKSLRAAAHHTCYICEDNASQAHPKHVWKLLARNTLLGSRAFQRASDIPMSTTIQAGLGDQSTPSLTSRGTLDHGNARFPHPKVTHEIKPLSASSQPFFVALLNCSIDGF